MTETEKMIFINYYYYLCFFLFCVKHIEFSRNEVSYINQIAIVIIVKSGLSLGGGSINLLTAARRFQDKVGFAINLKFLKNIHIYC